MLDASKEGQTASQPAQQVARQIGAANIEQDFGPAASLEKWKRHR